MILQAALGVAVSLFIGGQQIDCEAFQVKGETVRFIPINDQILYVSANGEEDIRTWGVEKACWAESGRCIEMVSLNLITAQGCGACDVLEILGSGGDAGDLMRCISVRGYLL